MAGDTPGRECPHDDLGMQPQIGTEKLSGGTVFDTDTGSPYGRGALPFSGVAGRSLPVDVTVAPVLPVEGPQSVPLQVAVVRVDGTTSGDTSGRRCPRDERDWRPPSGVCMEDGSAVSLSGGETLATPDVAGSLLPVVPAGGSPLVGTVNPAGPDGPVVAGGPLGPCETQSPSLYESLDPLEHSVLDCAGPDGQHVAVGLWARLGRCPHLPVTLLAWLARMLQGALLAQMFRLKFWNR